MLTVVLDTNVWISAALSAAGAPAQIAQHLLAHGSPVFSQATFDELRTRLWKPKFDLYISQDARHSLLHDLSAAALWVDISPDMAAATYSRDRSDDAFIHAALASQAQWLVTGDQDLLCITSALPFRIVTPAAALAETAFAWPEPRLT